MRDFVRSLLTQQDVLPEAHRLILFIRAAGPGGIPDNELRSAVELPRKTVDGLLAALVQAGQIRPVGTRVCISA